MRREFILVQLFSLLVIWALSQWWPVVGFAVIPLLPILLLGFRDMFQAKHAILRNFPVLGIACFA